MPPRRKRAQQSHLGYDFPAHPSDPEAWDRYVRSHLSADQRALLSEHYGRSPLRQVAEAIEDKAERQRWRRLWEAYVLNLDVEVLPGGRAVLRPRRPLGLRIPGRGKPVEEVGPGFRVEMQFEYVPGKGNAAWTARVVGEEGRPDLGADLWAYYTAFRLYAVAHPRKRFAPPRRRPSPGQPLDVDFYRRILAMHEDLLGRGHRAPASEIARRMSENPTTVRSWVFRARKIVGKEQA